MLPEPLAVAVFGADPLVARSLRVALAAEEGFEVVAGEGAEADLMLWDLGPASSTLLERPGELAGLPTVALVADEVTAQAALARGAAGVALRDGEVGRMAAALRAVARGFRVVDAGLELEGTGRPGPQDPAGASLPVEARADGDDGTPDPLSEREHEVLELLAEGRSNREIGEELGISSNTAKFHVAHVMDKLDALSRTEAVVRAIRLGLLEV